MIDLVDPATIVRLAFLLIILIAGVILGVYLIREINLPLDLVFERIGAEELSENAKERLEAVDEVAKQIGFEPIETFTVPGLAAVNENRLYWNKRERTRLVASYTTFRGRPALFLEFASAFEDDDRLSTNNIPPVSYIALPPWAEIDRHPGVEDADTLFQIHKDNLDKRIRQGKALKDSSISSLAKEIVREQKKLMDYQVESGRFRLNEQKGRYEGTWRIAPASLVFYVDPRSEKTSGLEAGIAIGLAFLSSLICVVITRLLHLDSFLVENFPTVVPPKAGFLAYCPAFIVSGLFAGRIIPRRGFVWGFAAGVAGLFPLPGSVGLKVLFPLICGQSGLFMNRVREAFSGGRPRLAGSIIVLAGLVLLGYFLAS